jgi:hypothetical protein
MISDSNINQNQRIIKRPARLLGYFGYALFVFMAMFSCKKDGPTRAIITVVDSASRPVSNATVTLWQDTAVNQVNGVQSKVRVTKTSDAAGKAQFDFQLEAFLNIEAIKNTDTGKSFIRLKEHETVDQTVRL